MGVEEINLCRKYLKSRSNGNSFEDVRKFV